MIVAMIKGSTMQIASEDSVDSVPPAALFFNCLLFLLIASFTPFIRVHYSTVSYPMQ